MKVWVVYGLYDEQEPFFNVFRDQAKAEQFFEATVHASADSDYPLVYLRLVEGEVRRSETMDELMHVG